MNNVEAFKNELRNYHYYKTKHKRLVDIYEQVQKIPSDELLDKFRLLKEFNKSLIREERKLDEVFTKLKGFHAIRYDKEPIRMSEEASTQMQLDLIDRYNVQLTKFQVELEYAESELIFQMNRLDNSIKNIENVLKQLPNDVAKACVDIYCNGKRYEDVSNGDNMFWSPSGLFKNVQSELEKALGKE